jgi:glycosyltransferase involved in cell wall biosynthesis
MSLPLVSICTPTFNRRPFIPYLIKCIEHQTYPRDRLEWIIVDDGTDKIGDLVEHLPYVKYFPYEKKMLLGEKRNILNAKGTGEFFVYMDDDDYYPPARITHAVETLQANPAALCAGSSIVHIYFKSLDKIFQFGPYGPKHSTAATFAFRRALLKDHQYDEKIAVSEERSFLKNYTVPFVQLDPFQSILVFAHDHNSVNKEMLLENAHPDYIKPTTLLVKDFVKEPDMRAFYMHRLPMLLQEYTVGKPEGKPEMLKQIEELKRVREAEWQRQKKEGEGKVTIRIGDGPPKVLSIQEVVGILQQQHEHINQLTEMLKGKDMEINLLTTFLQPFEKRLDQKSV